MENIERALYTLTYVGQATNGKSRKINANKRRTQTVAGATA